jgi:hypothetical protein
LYAFIGFSFKLFFCSPSIATIDELSHALCRRCRRSYIEAYVARVVARVARALYGPRSFFFTPPALTARLVVVANLSMALLLEDCFVSAARVVAHSFHHLFPASRN